MIKNAKNGKCGDAKYMINGDTLTFYGNGTLAEHNSYTQMAWVGNPDIKRVEIAEGSHISAPPKFENYFYDMKGLEDISGLSGLDTSNVKSMRMLFSRCESLKDFSPIADWNVSRVNSLYETFAATGLDDLKTFERWDTSSVNNFLGTFKGCTELTSLDGAENFDVSNGKCFMHTFADTKVSDLTPLKDWTPPAPSSYLGMFCGCEQLENADAIDGWNMSEDDRTRIFEGTNIDPAALEKEQPENDDIEL